MNEVYDIVYVKTDGYSASNNQTIAWEIEKMNQQFLNEGKNYVLVGPGRWGSSDTWLGIPVKWPHISAARVIVEAGLTNYRVDPSQGTHFFQNLTSFGVGYFTINAFMNDGVYNQDFLNAQPAIEETRSGDDAGNVNYSVNQRLRLRFSALNSTPIFMSLRPSA